jgi:ATP-binding cassette subfamily F protein 3
MRAKMEARRAHLQSFVDRFRAGTKARQAQSRLKMIERLGAIPPVVEEGTAPFLLPSPEKPLPPPLLRLERAAVGYGGRTVLDRLDLRLDPGDRIGLLGVNGAGKTTLARVIAGDLPVLEGRRLADRRMKVGWFHQHQTEVMAPDDTPQQIIGRALPELSEAQRRGRLGAFGFGQDRASTRIDFLSGGERARLLINLIGLGGPHLVILDEPTNHLDIDSRKALVDALNDYEGAVVLVSHDRALVEMVADRLWIAADGTVRPFDGDLEDYARLVLERARSAARSPGRKAGSPASPPPADAAPLRRRLDAAESALARESRALAELDADLAALDGRDKGAAARLVERRDKLSERVSRAEAAWLAAAEAYEAAAG